MGVCQRHPYDAIFVDVHAARRIAVHWRLRIIPRYLVIFGKRSLRRVGAREMHDSTRKAQCGAPDRAVGRADGDAIKRGDNALVLLRIDRLVWHDIIVALAVAVGVEHERSPALRGGGIAGRQELLCV
jgi:hypothetical protein